MNKVEVKTNIMCNSCIAKVTPSLNEKFGEANWSVNILTPKKVLTVNAENLEMSDVIDAVEKAGYKAEPL
jgi:copper chaperone